MLRDKVAGGNLDKEIMNGPWRDANHIRMLCVKKLEC